MREKFSNWIDAINIFDLNPYKKRCEHINIEVKLSKKTDDKSGKTQAISPSGKPYLEEDWID